MKFKPGIYFGKPRAEYDLIPCMNISTLLNGLQSMMHLQHYIKNRPQEMTDALRVGIAAHICTYERETFSARVIQSQKFDRRKPAEKLASQEFEAANAGKLILDKEQFESCVSIRDAIYKHPIASEIANAKGFGEVTALWEHETEYGAIQCKGLLDRLCQWKGWPIISDLKTCEDASPKAFQRAVANYHYGVKAAWYLDALSAIAPLKKGKRRFLWIAVEKTAPFGVAIYEPDDECLDNGRKVYRQLLNDYAKAEKTGTWAGYQIGIEPIKLAPWQKEKETA